MLQEECRSSSLCPQADTDQPQNGEVEEAKPKGCAWDVAKGHEKLASRAKEWAAAMAIENRRWHSNVGHSTGGP